MPVTGYHHILVGLDLTPDESDVVFAKAKRLAELYNAKLSLAHVIEPLVYAYGGEVPIDFSSTQKVIEERATAQLHEIAVKKGLDLSDAHVLLGPTATELKEFANDHNVDLIVLGSHGRHGLALLLGSTATDAIRGAKCDVLAVRV